MAAKLAPVLLAAFLMTHASASAQTARNPIRYTLSFPSPSTHYVEVTAVVPTEGRQDVEMMMAVWTPGSYLIREYERNVEAVTAAGGGNRALDVEKSQKNRWRISTGGAAEITLKYRVYCREMSVRTNWVESAFAFLNGAPTFMTLADLTPRPHEVTILPAAGWRRSITALPELGEGDHRYRAPDFDTLVDSPIVVGNPTMYEFVVDGRKHYLVNQGEDGVFDGPRAAKDFQTIVAEHRRMWGSLPYEKYVLFNLMTMVADSGGGIEHRNSATLMTSRWATRTRRAYLAWLEVASHEHFHAWNGKRLRPAELGPFDYENELFTRSLWEVEGFTDYYGELSVHRAGLSTADELLDGLSNRIEGLQNSAGRLVQSVEAASFDAWIKFYRPDENFANAAVSYYSKGAIIAFLLDAHIRQVTNGSRGVDDVMRAAFAKYSGAKGFTSGEFRAVAEQVAGGPLQRFWETAIEGTAELDYAEALETFGLRFKPAETPTADRPGKAWLGLSVRNDAGRLVVTQVRRNTPAFDAGINVEDEILAIDDFRVRADRWDNRLDQYKPGEAVSILLARRDQLLRLNATFGSEPLRRWRLEVDPAATEAQQTQLRRWLQP